MSIDLNASKEERDAAKRADMQQRSRLERLQRADDMRTVMGTVAGRRFIWRLLNEAGLFSGSYTGEAFSSAYGEGKRAVAVKLMSDLQAESKDAYVTMVAERLAALPERLAPSTKERLE